MIPYNLVMTFSAKKLSVNKRFSCLSNRCYSEVALINFPVNGREATPWGFTGMVEMEQGLGYFGFIQRTCPVMDISEAYLENAKEQRKTPSSALPVTPSTREFA